MKNRIAFYNLAVIIIALFGLVSCSRNSKSSEIEYSRNMQAADMGNKSEIPVPEQVNTTKMLRNAKLKFRVTDVSKSTGAIEKMARLHGGYVAESHFNIDESETLIKKRNTDSAEEIKKLMPHNHIEVFVLNTQLDTFLDAVSPMVDHLEFRHINAYDKQIEHTTIHNEPIKDSHTYNGAFAAGSSQLNTKYARVTMDIYQTPIVRKWIIPNPDSFEVARGGFGEDFIASLKTGARGVGIVFNILVSFWPLILIGLGVYFVLKNKQGKKLWMQIFKRRVITQ